MTFQSEQIVAKYEAGAWIGDAELLEITSTLLKYAAKMGEYLRDMENEYEADTFSHARSMWLGPIPILYEEEVQAFIVFEDHGPVVYQAKRKEN